MRFFSKLPVNTVIQASALIALIAFCVIATAHAADPPAKAGSKPVTAPAPAKPDAERFVDNADATVLDQKTGLIWARDANPAGIPLTWHAAKQYISDMNLGRVPNFGATNWHMPSIADLTSIVDTSQSNPALPARHPFTNINQNFFYWSTTTEADVVDLVWIIDFSSGQKTFIGSSSCNYNILWPVRSEISAKDPSGSVYATGVNESGQLADGTTASRIELLPVKGQDETVKISAGAEHSLAIESDGTVAGWGRNEEGQLGDGTLKNALAPVAVKGLWKIKDVSAGTYHSLAMRSDGTVWAWGRNTYGQLGDSTEKDSAKPVQTGILKDIVAISAGTYHSLALRKDGTVWAWGRNTYGQLGDGTTADRNYPLKVESLRNVKAIAAGHYHSIALTGDGSVWVWGWNSNGILGDGTREDRHSPVQLTGLSGFVQVSAGLYHTVALRSNGSVWAWGLNDYGQLGTSAVTKASLPIEVEGLDNTIKLSAGMYHSVALKNDGTVWVWGKDTKDLAEKPLPAKLKDISGVTDVKAGKYYTILIKANE